MRLRDTAEKLRDLDPNMVIAMEWQYIPIGQIAHEAADEIERLQELVAELRKQEDERDH